MNEKVFGQQYFAIFSAAKDNLANNLVDVCTKEGFSKETTQRIVSIAQLSVESTATNAYQSLWRTVQNFFRSSTTESR